MGVLESEKMIIFVAIFVLGIILYLCGLKYAKPYIEKIKLKIAELRQKIIEFKLKVAEYKRVIVEFKELYLRAFEFVKPYKEWGILAIICTLGASACTLYLPLIIKNIIDEVLADKNIFMLRWISIGVVIVFLAKGVFVWGQQYSMSSIAQGVIVDIRKAIIEKMSRLSLSYYDTHKTGSIMSYITNDVPVLQNVLVDKVISLVSETATLIGSIVAMLLLNWRLFLFVFFVVLPVVGLMSLIGKKIGKAGRWMQESSAELNAVLQEIIASPRVIKAFAREQYEVDRFQTVSRDNYRANMKTAQQTAMLSPLVEFVAACGIAIVLWYGGKSVIQGDVKAGEIIAFLTLAINFTNPVKRLSNTIGGIQRAIPAGKRVFEIFDEHEDITDKPNAENINHIVGNVEFKEVSFAYKQDELVLKKCSFRAKPGDVIAFVGPSGAGKSTVASLLPRFYDVTEGAITIDGIDVRDVRMESLREQIGIVPQETALFNGSVYDNIRYGRLDATVDEIEAAAKAANAHNFIVKLPYGYNTMLGDRGTNISGGQRQRIAIARAILKNPQILILDEATSALDTESERVVQEALNHLMVGRTTFVIAHRLSTITDANQILVMDKGELVEKGTHKELLEKDGLYAKLWRIQQNSNSGDNS